QRLYQRHNLHGDICGDFVPRIAMRKSKFSITHEDEAMSALVAQTDQKTLALWAIDCAERVMPYFEEKYPEDNRPRQAIDTLKTWIETGVFSMAVIRKASLDAHAAAREVGEDSPARSAARAAGQAVATAHVPRHAYGPAIYAQQAIHRATNPADADTAAAKERDWQYQHLIELREN
ncbi:MAG: putative immunity protein, partial [Candidatus Promineifilaceae bacterium]